MPPLDDPSPVLIVGAGLAGLTAARALGDAGVSTVVLEARSRVGGRACTVVDGFADGQYGELGGELIPADYTLLPTLCAELGIPLSAPHWIERPSAHPDESALEAYLAEGRVVVDGAPLRGARFVEVDREVREALRLHPPAPSETVEQWCRRSRMSPAGHSAVGAISRMPSQCDPWQVDAHYLTEGHVGAPRRIVGGSQRLAEALAQNLDVRLDTPVRTVRQTGGRVQVDLENGERMLGGQAVVAVPGFVLATMGFDPPLPPPQLGTLTSLQRSVGGKVIAQYAEGDAVRAAIGHAVFSDGPVNTAWVSNPHITNGPAVVTGFVCGTASPLLEDDAAASAALDRLVEAVVGSRVTRIAGQSKNWSIDPYALGMGTVVPHPARGPHAALVATAERRVHFAGAYTDPDLTDTLEGAVRSGYRAAREVLRFPNRIHVDEINTRMVRR